MLKEGVIADTDSQAWAEETMGEETVVLLAEGGREGGHMEELAVVVAEIWEGWAVAELKGVGMAAQARRSSPHSRISTWIAEHR